MGRGSEGDFEQTERESAAELRPHRSRRRGRAGRLPGRPGDDPGLNTCAARMRPARIRRQEGPPLTYFRASMVVGARSESYLTLRHLVQKLPVMIAPSWLKTRPSRSRSKTCWPTWPRRPRRRGRGREVQFGCPDVVSYGEMLDRMALAMDRRPPAQDPGARAFPLAVLALDRSGHPCRRRRGQAACGGPVHGDHGHRPSGAALFDVEPMGIDEALRAAVAEERRYRASSYIVPTVE